jgi:excisionase family DNA binding protein
MNIRPQKGETSIAPRALRVDDFCKVVGISRTTFYDLIKRGQLRAVRLGGRTVVPATEIDRLLAEAEPLPAAAGD